MISYNNPKVELIPNPVGIDKAIQSIQERLSGISWLQVVFGRATKQVQIKSGTLGKRASTRTIIPEVYYKREPMSVMINDNLKSYCFFVAEDPMEFNDYKPYDNDVTATQKVSIIFWMNLEKINPVKKYNFVEELRAQIIKHLMNSNFQISESYLEHDEIFEPFTITETFQNYLKPPFAAFKISGELSFNYLDCVEGIADEDPTNPDTGEVVTGYLTDENGNFITDENGNKIELNINM